ncbi:MAG: glutaminyl-tRNA synthase (glutamine-hydrolyzing) subunit A [Candidatus Terrybacteria bacterium RIFCSPLOWO2_01_FULL_58_14]|uniref:Glutamyl-tRNA(Gln) amidotransferase subunit A n=2 Tax=Candidatus Terryibacteriota TaxID=1817920 RepID=A0A1G2Q0V6_9BACT|nr:MAG: glutaminyl-tRNA synthase (glutamine-hydrolyzing) subunit A [Candidatus Terrybacteria bacterium RIFCSPHIGHO2_01_FULL_58_15]OHA54193.1 MAG: glutaminyl-tRNA synthase (glutamine-hydrolyzing) subunit A [Candidatus Terrybacteria bacterium RIFCSPLOWO2_01_FULL_58_14]
MTADPTKLTITEAAVRFREGTLTPSALTEAHLAAIAQRDGDIHAYLSVFADEARKDAAAADRRFREGAAGSALDGMPIAVKDNILVSGKPATAGSRILESYVASYDATVIAKLKAEGAIILGKTNLDEFAMGASTEHSAFGPTRNPRDLTRVPGGSSGGSAAAVAADLCAAALGSDTGGSVRQPAAFCGVTGLKPTYGRVSRSGLIAMASSLDQIGPLAKCTEDAEIVFNAIAGHDPLDATTHEKPPIPNSPWPGRQSSISGLRVGLPKEYFGEGLDPRIRESAERASEALRKEGATISEVSLPHTPHALAVYYLLMPSEVSANLARFDGIRYGASILRDSRPTPYRAEGSGSGFQIPDSRKDFWDVYFETRRQFFGDEVKRRIMLGTFALSSGYYDAYYGRAQQVRALIQRDFTRVFTDVDVLLTPTSPVLPFRFGERLEDPLAMYLADIYTVSANLAGVPGLVLPFGAVEEDGRMLPVGLQLMGAPFAENTLFSVGKALEAANRA